jgi:hypothetical protein
MRIVDPVKGIDFDTRLAAQLVVGPPSRSALKVSAPPSAGQFVAVLSD